MNFARHELAKTWFTGIGIGIGIGIVLLNRKRVTFSSGTLFFCLWQRSWPSVFFSLSTRRPYSTWSSCYARGTCGRSQCLRLPEGREEKPQPGGKRRAAWDTPAATPISDVAVHTSDARISTTPRAHPHTHNEISLYTARVGNPTNIPLYSLISSIASK